MHSKEFKEDRKITKPRSLIITENLGNKLKTPEYTTTETSCLKIVINFTITILFTTFNTIFYFLIIRFFFCIVYLQNEIVKWSINTLLEVRIHKIVRLIYRWQARNRHAVVFEFSNTFFIYSTSYFW